MAVSDSGSGGPVKWSSVMPASIAQTFRLHQPGAGVRAYGSIEEPAKAEKINPSYVSRILRLTLLAPDIVELMLNGIHDPKLILATLMQPFPGEWARQRSLWALPEQPK